MRERSLLFLRNFGVHYRNEIILTLLWILAIIIVNPIGEFPLNDDWAFSKNVYHLSEEGKLIFSAWPAMTLIAQVLWGALVTSIFGFSFTVLRLSTLFIGLFTVLIFYRILVKATTNKTTSLAGALLIMFSPLFFYSSYTFMTEVYFLFTLILSLFFFYNFYNTEKIKFLLISSFFVLVSTLIRQPGIAIGIAFAIIYLFNKRFTLKRLATSITPTIIASIGLYSYSLWLQVTNRTTSVSDISVITKQLSEASFEYYWVRFGVIALYFGLFTLPLSILLLPRIWKKYNWYEKWAIFLLGIIAYWSGILNNFPSGNIVYNLGLGPKLLKDSYWKENIDPILSDQSMTIIKLFSLFSAVIIVSLFCMAAFKGIKKIYQTKCSPARLLRATAIVFFLIYFAFVLINPIFFDRYVLPCLPLLFLILLPVKPLITRFKGIVYISLISVYVIFCVAATHDYLSWNRARWLAIDYITKELKIEREKIDGGFEFNCWYQTGEWHPEIKDQISWWFVGADDYVVSFGKIKRFKAIKKIAYFRLLPLGTDSLSILIKEGKVIPDSAFPIRCDCEKRSADNNFFLCDNSDIDFEGGNLQSNSESLSGEYSIKLDSAHTYGLLSKYGDLQKNDHIIIKVWRKGSDQKAGIVVAGISGFNFYNFNTSVKETNSKGWELIQTEIILPENHNGLNIGIYLWNPGKNTVWFDDLEIYKLQKKDN